MAQPVWVLSVDLQAKTATFQSGLADAAKGARGSFSEIKSGAGEMGSHVSTNMFASRHAIMAVSEAFGDTMPRAITALLVHIGPLGAALEAAFPFAAIGLAAVLLIEHLTKLRAEGVKMTEDQVRFGTAVQNAFNTLDQKLLQAQIKSDELRNDHLGALHKQLELIDRQSMAELVHSFGEVAKAADVVFTDMKSHWDIFGGGATGAKHAMDDFQTRYDSLLAQGKTGEATDLLKGTRESAEKVLALQRQAAATTGGATRAATGGEAGPQLLQHEAALAALKKSGAGYSENEVRAQEALVGALGAQMEIEQKVAALKTQDAANATKSTGNELAGKAAEGARQLAEHKMKLAEMELAGEREQAQVSETIHQTSIAARLAQDLSFADREYAIQSQGNKDLAAALDKAGKDYTNQLAAMHQKAEELEQQHQNTVAVLKGKAEVETYRKSLEDLAASERANIEATETGSSARLAAIDAAIRNEQSMNLQDTAHYRELLTQRVEVARQSAAEEAKVKAEYGRIMADDTQKMAELALAAEREQYALRDSSRRMTAQMRMDEELHFSQAETALKMTAISQEIAALDKGGKEYQNKLQELQNKQKQLIQAHENEVTAIRARAEIDRNQRISSSRNKFNDELATGLSRVLTGQETFATMMTKLGDEMAEGMIRNAIKAIVANDMTKPSDAAAAARDAYKNGEAVPVIGPVLGPIWAAAAYAGVMAFAGGTDYVPGIGRGDTVPAMLTPGEGVVPGGVMDGLRKMAASGGMAGGDTTTVHVHYQNHIKALDSQGVARVLDKHGDTLQKHFEATLRKMNR